MAHVISDFKTGSIRASSCCKVSSDIVCNLDLVNRVAGYKTVLGNPVHETTLNRNDRGGGGHSQARVSFGQEHKPPTLPGQVSESALENRCRSVFHLLERSFIELIVVFHESILAAYIRLVKVTPNLYTVALFGSRQIEIDRPVAQASELLQDAAKNRNPRIASLQSSWYQQEEIDISRWYKMYPYQLLVVEAKQDPGDPQSASYQIHGDWQYTFPLPPEALSETIPFAITTIVTQGGIIEEHNGTPLRPIQLRGTVGLLPGRGRAPQQTTPTPLESIAGGTLNAVSGLQSAFTDLQLSASGQAPVNPNTHDMQEFDVTESTSEVLPKTVGYYQIHRLRYFLEAYAAIRKERKGTNLRLAFCNWKDQAVYLVSPNNLAIPRSGASPFEYPFEVSFTAFRRIRLEKSSFLVELPKPLRRDPGALARVINTVQNARRVVQGISKVATAAVGDIERLILEPLREVILFSRDVTGAATTLGDLPDAIKIKAKTAYLTAQGRPPAQTKISGTANDSVRKQLQTGRQAANELADMDTPRARAARVKTLAIHPAGAPFEKPAQNLDFFESVDLGTLDLGPAVTTQIATEKARVRSLTRLDFEIRRDQVRRTADRLSVALGAGDPTFEETFEIDVTPIKDAPSDSDWEVLWALNDAVEALDSLAATGDDEKTSRETSVEVMAALHRRSGIAFQVPTSKFAVPFQYGETLESLSARYLGTPDRYGEIIALNGLRSPYVDEVGFDIALLVNGSGQEVVIPTDSLQDRLGNGQMVYIWSNARTRTSRRITAMRTVGAQTAITVDGLSNMGDYKVSDGAKISSFLPGTINSQQLVYIPSNSEPLDGSFITKSIPGVDEFDQMVQVGGVDLLLDTDNDLIFTPDGDTRLAAGLSNILQNTRIMLSVERGTYLRHPTFGIPIRIGSSSSDFKAKDAVNAIRRMLQEDNSFSRVQQVSVTSDGKAVQINIGVVVSGTQTLVPIGFSISA